MNRVSRVSRTYWLGDYRNLIVTDEIEGVPDELLFDVNFVNKLKYLQLVSIELTYRKYVDLLAKYPLDDNEAIQKLTQLRDTTSVELKHITNGDTAAIKTQAQDIAIEDERVEE